jgi:hypothetical protein
MIRFLFDALREGHQPRTDVFGRRVHLIPPGTLPISIIPVWPALAKPFQPRPVQPVKCRPDLPHLRLRRPGQDRGREMR